jgi:hypothetical protein
MGKSLAIRSEDRTVQALDWNQCLPQHCPSGYVPDLQFLTAISRGTAHHEPGSVWRDLEVIDIHIPQVKGINDRPCFSIPIHNAAVLGPRHYTQVRLENTINALYPLRVTDLEHRHWLVPQGATGPYYE